MVTRILLVGLCLALITHPSFADDPKDEGAVTIQVQSMSKILGDVRVVAGEDAVKEMDNRMRGDLGERGFTGLDTLRPSAARITITGPIKKDEDDFNKNLKAIGIVPITNQKDFIALLERADLKVRESKQTQGLYTLSLYNAEDAPPMKLRFDDDHAYIEFNGPVNGMIAKGLSDITDMIDPREPGVIACRLNMSKFPKSMPPPYDGHLTQYIAMFAFAGASKQFMDSIVGAYQWYENTNKRIYTEGESALGRLTYDRITKEAILEAIYVAKKGTPLAKWCAELKPSTNQFAGMYQRDAAAGVLYSIPITVPELQKVLVEGINEGVKEIKRSDPPPAKFMPLFDATHRGIVRTIKSGGFDGVVKLIGPDADGLFTASTALTFDDPSKIEKAARVLVKNAPGEIQAMIELDAAKVNGVNIHKINIGPAMAFSAQNVFGEKAAVCVAFAPKAIYITFGPAAMDAIKVAMLGKGGPSAAFDSYINHAKMQKFVASIDADAGTLYTLVAGTDDKPLTTLRVTIQGGEQLRYRMITNVTTVPGLIIIDEMIWGTE